MPFIHTDPQYSKQFLHEISRGLVPGFSPWSKIALNADVDNVEEDMWVVGGTYTWPTAKMKMEVVSDSANDTSAGTGVQQVRIYYLTDAFVEKTTDVTLSGTTPVETTATDIFRVNRVRPIAIGTGLKAAGNIDVRHVDNTPIYARIPAGSTRLRQMIYTVPTGKNLYITDANLSVGHASGGRYARFTLRSNWEDVQNARVA